jgi:hypothetical protein
MLPTRQLGIRRSRGGGSHKPAFYFAIDYKQRLSQRKAAGANLSTIYEQANRDIYVYPAGLSIRFSISCLNFGDGRRTRLGWTKRGIAAAVKMIK